MPKLTSTAFVPADEINEDVLKKIGGTPLIQIKNIAEKECPGVEIYGKAEWFNAGGSVKARPALHMIQKGIETGELKPGMTILDSTSGNTGVAYALIGLVLGYKVKLVMPQNVCNERKQLMASGYHAEIAYSDPLEGSDGAILKCREIYKENPDSYFWPDQYNNPANWEAHYQTTAKEIWEQTNHRVTHFVAGIGTTGTIMGTSRGLKALNPDIKCYAVEPAESLHGIEGLKHMETSIVPGFYDEAELYGKISVKTEDAYKMVYRTQQEENLNIGTSSGAALYAVIELAKTLKEGVVVTVFPDACECDVTYGLFRSDSCVP
ncbi:Cysteine synthase B [hydrothermal vent metagenome]|uniref:Cysteine synthase B n=1 Tax=hydrothermal vent metagenome TaxID=652676 RepID=A0A3B1CGM6_9ZZZZ